MEEEEVCGRGRAGWKGDWVSQRGGPSAVELEVGVLLLL